MGNAAHVESLDHEVYKRPFTVVPKTMARSTPPNYHDRNLSEQKLPNQMEVWLVQESDRNSVVARAYGFDDSPDTEVLALGFNSGKEYGAVGIGRHGNFLQWGYSDPPSRMTEPGRRLFVNCIHYIRRFDGQRPLVYRQDSHRLNALRLAAIINRISGDRKEFFLRTFGESLYDKYGSDPEGLVRYYRENIEWIYRDQGYRVDEDLKALGVNSNRTLRALENLIALLEDADKAATTRRLLERYTVLSFDEVGQWREWLGQNRDRIFFTDVGGYKFLVAPPEYVTQGS